MARLIGKYLPPSPDEVKSIREKAGKTQKEWADMLGTTERQLSRYETGDQLVPKPVWLLMKEKGG